MTVITKPITEKKFDKLDQPLVVAECLPHQDAESGAGDSLPPQDPRYLVLRARARRASSITTACLLLMALLVMCCGVLGGFYLYKQYAYAQMHRLRGWCRIPYEQLNEQAALYEEYNKQLPEFQELQTKEHTKQHFISEEFDIDDDNDSYEKFTVANFNGGRGSRFIHDFNANKTGIIDVDGHRCFVMPLNRTQVVPPRDLIDLVRKMWQGYYEVNTDTIRETMRVVLPPIKEPHTAGMYIERECAGYPIYKLEKIVSGVFKRSISEQPYLFFNGRVYNEFDIDNINELKAWELKQSHT